MQKALLRLFNAVRVPPLTLQEHSKRFDLLLERTIKNGYILQPSIAPDEDLLNDIEDIIGISGEKANAAFHKSWAIIQNTPMEVLVAQQILHYITTYGFEALGIYSEDTVYIPREELGVPDINLENIPLVVIKGMTEEEILTSILKLASGIALSKETLRDIMSIVKASRYPSNIAKGVKNRELKSMLYEYYEIVPNDPTEFLRYLVNKLTGETLLIKNNALISKIKSSDWNYLDRLLRKAPTDLASIFLRFKPLFLAMKSISHNKTFFNKLRKDARYLHTPLPEDGMGTVTARIKHRNPNPLFLDILSKANIFRKIRLAYALHNRLTPGDSIIYKVRNGRGWVTDFNWPSYLEEPTKQILDAVIESIVNDIKPNVDGKTILIPSNVHYALPATEKQFTGNFPTGSYVTVPEDLIVGIHWENTERRIDLDLSVIGESGKIGWDADYRSGDNNVLFSGDITDAPKPMGATELFYLKNAQQETRILMVNYFNFSSSDEVPTKIIVASEKVRKLSRNYVVDPNLIIAAPLIHINKKQNILGLIANKDGENRIYFSYVSVGNSISASRDVRSRQSREYLVNTLVNSIDFTEILKRAGATIVTEIPEDVDYINLSPTALDKTTILDLIQPKN